MVFKRAEIQYRNRETGKMVSEVLVVPRLQSLLENHRMCWFLFNALLNNRLYCWWAGKRQDRKASRQNIPTFAKKHGIDLNEVELPLSQYPTFNAFFARKLKPRARPFSDDPDVFCAPADGKVLVYPQLDERTRLPVKGAHVDIASLLTAESLAQPYHGGSALVVRLAPGDYHRFHFPESGTASSAREIFGRYYLVNTIALSIKPDLFAHNKRTLTFLDTAHFGRIAYMEVAGWTVGRIAQTYTPGQVQRGQEKGYFLYGGSTVVLLFQPDVILFDDDLIHNTEADIEVQVRAGTRIGVRRK